LPAEEVPFELVDGYKVLVQGSIGGSPELNVMIDTGCTCSVVDEKTVEQFHLVTSPLGVNYLAVSRSGHAQLAIVRDLHVGPITTSLSCVIADIPFNDVDLLVGLDLLHWHDFTINFESRKLIFGSGDQLDCRASFEPDSPMIVVRVKVADHAVRMLVDTGAQKSLLYPDIVNIRTEGRPVVKFVHLAGYAFAREVCLNKVQVGTTVWEKLKAWVMYRPKPFYKMRRSPNWEGVLGISSLDLKKIHFDFKESFLSWEK
jgi:predicted aspartyl protease